MNQKLVWIYSLLILLGLSGCSGGGEAPATTSLVATPAGNRSSPEPAVSVSEPIVARVNGESILWAEFEKRVQQFQEAELEAGLTGDEAQARFAQIQQQVLDGLIDQTIIEQAAQAQGVVISDEELEQKIQEMKRGQAEEEFQRWLALNDFTADDFRNTLRSQLIAANLYAVIIAQAPTMMEQVHARQILVRDADLAQAIMSRLQAGESFVELAQQFSEDEASRINGGDLGWFPRGIHFVPPQVEEVAFYLESGQISPVIESVLGYHIVKVERKALDRALTPQQMQLLQASMFNDWLARQRASAQIERYLN